VALAGYGCIMKPAFSTLAVPSWTFDKIFERVEAWGYLGCELRTFGHASTRFACDPALTDASKLRRWFDAAGLQPCSLATGVRFDEKVGPPVLATVVSDTTRCVRECSSLVDLAVQMECPLVRVFAFELPEGERRVSGVARIVERLKAAVDHCRNSGVRLMLENGGSFPRSSELAEILDSVDSPLLTACYNAPVAMRAGEHPRDGINVLGERCAAARVLDMKGVTPVALGAGELRCRETVDALGKAGFGGWLIHEFDAAWLALDDPSDVESVMRQSCEVLFRWIGAGVPAGR
jgi:sugar phosphate isomerase/epimerase